MSGQKWVANIYSNVLAAQEQGEFDWVGRTHDPFDGGPVGSIYEDVGNGQQGGLPGTVEVSAEHARLIAAAPDLYEALQWASETLAAAGVESGTVGQLAKIKARVDAALAKAAPRHEESA